MKRVGNRYIVLAAACLLLSCTEKHEGIRIAAPDGLCGVLAYSIAGGKGLEKVEIMDKVFPLVDCCSTKAEWAMSAERVDVAWLCPDAAENLVKKDDRFVILGPALVNSEILVIRESGNPRRIAYSHKREYQKTLILKRFGEGCEAIPVLPAALPYVYEQGNVDGVVVDVLTGLSMKGAHLSVSDDGRDVVTYMLVASKRFVHGERLQPFLAALRHNVAKFNAPNRLARVLLEQKKLAPDATREIASLSVRFIPPATDETR